MSDQLTSRPQTVSLRCPPGPLQALVRVPGSKSITNRALLVAAVSNGISTLSDILIADDTLAMVGAIRRLGVEIEVDQERRVATVYGCSGLLPNDNANVWCGSSGTVARFLLPQCAARGGDYHFDGTEQLRSRPMGALLHALADQGVDISPQAANYLPVSVKGTGLKGGVVDVEGQQSSQFLSGLLMASPLAGEPCLFRIDDLVSVPYVAITRQVMREFGVETLNGDQPTSVRVPAPQSYAASSYAIEPDASTASYFFAAAAVTGGSVTVSGLWRQSSIQGDIAFLRVLEEMGCRIDDGDSGVTVEGPDRLRGISVDMRDISDTFLTLACIAPFADGPVIIRNIGHVRYKESNRLRAIESGLGRCGVPVETSLGTLTIKPANVSRAVIDSYQDHRVAMAFSILGLRVEGLRIRGAECVSKTCPEFFELWKSLCPGSRVDLNPDL